MPTDNKTTVQKKKSLAWLFFPLLLQGLGIYRAPMEGTGVSDDSTIPAAAGESWAAAEGATQRERKKKSPFKYIYLKSKALQSL